MRQPAVYLDSSALVKLVVKEPQSAALRRYLRPRPRSVSSALARVEVLRAVHHFGPSALEQARLILRRVSLVAFDDTILDAAAMLDPRILRSLDAIHLASALALGEDLGEVVTYDERLAEGAFVLGLVVAAPR